MNAGELPAAQTDTGPITVSVAIQMSPLWRIDRPGVAWSGDLPPYAEQLTRWLVRNLELFTGPRDGDLFVAVSVARNGDSAGHEYRDGHYVEASE